MQRILCLAQGHNGSHSASGEGSNLQPLDPESALYHSAIMLLCHRPKTIWGGRRWGSRIVLSVKCSGQLKGMEIWDSLINTNSSIQPSVFTLFKFSYFERIPFFKDYLEVAAAVLMAPGAGRTSHTST